MTSAEWRRLFTKLRTLRWLVRMKREEAAKQSYSDTMIYGRNSIHYELMTSHRQRTQFSDALNEIGGILIEMTGGNLGLQSLIITLILDVWNVRIIYPNARYTVYHDKQSFECRKIHIWQDLMKVSRITDSATLGNSIMAIDKIIDSKPKNYANQVMMLKLTL